MFFYLYQAANSNLQAQYDSIVSENLQLQAKIKIFEKNEMENAKNLHMLRNSNDSLKEKLKHDLEEISSQLKIEIIRLEKQSDEKIAENQGKF